MATAVAEAEKTSFQEGYKAGLKQGAEDVLATHSVDGDWSLAQEVVEHLMFKDPARVQYGADARDKVDQLAESWRGMRNWLAWRDLSNYLHLEYKRRMQSLRIDEGSATVNREIMTFVEAIMNIPVAAAKYQARMQPDGPQDAAVVIKD